MYLIKISILIDNYYFKLILIQDFTLSCASFAYFGNEAVCTFYVNTYGAGVWFTIQYKGNPQSFYLGTQAITQNYYNFVEATIPVYAIYNQPPYNQASQTIRFAGWKTIKSRISLSCLYNLKVKIFFKVFYEHINGLYVGCYWNTAPNLANYQSSFSFYNMTIQMCVDFCVQNGTYYAGLQGYIFFNINENLLSI